MVSLLLLDFRSAKRRRKKLQGKSLPAALPESIPSTPPPLPPTPIGTNSSGLKGQRSPSPRLVRRCLPSSSHRKRVSWSQRIALPTRSGGRGCRRAARSGRGPGASAPAAEARWQCSRSASASKEASSANSAARGSGARSAQKRKR